MVVARRGRSLADAQHDAHAQNTHPQCNKRLARPGTTGDPRRARRRSMHASLRRSRDPADCAGTQAGRRCLAVHTPLGSELPQTTGSRWKADAPAPHTLCPPTNGNSRAVEQSVPTPRFSLERRLARRLRHIAARSACPRYRSFRYPPTSPCVKESMRYRLPTP